MSDRVMVESSMLIHRDSANYLLALAASGPLDVVVSARLLEVAASEPEALGFRLAPSVGVSSILFDSGVTRRLARELQGRLETYQAPANLDWPYERFVELVRDDLAASILYDEWAFLISESWLFSKTREAFDKMVEAGGTAIHFSQQQFDRLVRKTLKKGPDEELSAGNRVRAATKWVAVGGPAILGLVEPISAAASSAAAGFFFLYDP